MWFYKSVLIFCSISCACINYVCAEKSGRKFPNGFKFGAATSAYQIEGAWDADGKTESILDYVYHNDPEEKIEDGSNGDVAANSYYMWERDVEMMRELGLDYYRFSLAWTRILPYNYTDRINPKGVAYYNNLINEMLKHDIEPVVTLYHWDLPLQLAQAGGWTNPLIVDWYSDYARTAFELFGDRVKHWITLNEPYVFCFYRHRAEIYKCMKNCLLAHAKVYHMYDDEFRHTQNGSIFITISAEFHEPIDAENVEAAEDAANFYWGVFAHPIFSKDGDYPASMKARLAAKSAEQGLSSSKLPELTPEEIKYIKGTSDYFGLNHYTTHYVYRNESQNDFPVPSFFDDLGVHMYQPSSWQIGESKLVYWVPWGFYKVLTKIREEYENPPVFITENGFATRGGIQDHDRIKYYKTYLCALLDAMDEGSDVRAYTAWSLMDNFEWPTGYSDGYGLYEVDFESEERTRTPRASAFMYQELLRTRRMSCKP